MTNGHRRREKRSHKCQQSAVMMSVTSAALPVRISDRTRACPCAVIPALPGAIPSKHACKCRYVANSARIPTFCSTSSAAQYVCFALLWPAFFISSSARPREAASLPAKPSAQNPDQIRLQATKPRRSSTDLPPLLSSRLLFPLCFWPQARRLAEEKPLRSPLSHITSYHILPS